MEKRHMHFTSELKVRNEEEGAFIEGYFAVFNQETELFQGAFEEIAPGAFDKSLRENAIFCLDNHDTRSVLADTVSRTLELRVDDHGLWGKVELDLEDPVAKSAYRKVKTGKVRGCSFGFIPIKEETDFRDDGTVKWRVLEADTKEVSITAFPAYAQTDIRTRAKQKEQHEQKKLESKKLELKERIKKC